MARSNGAWDCRAVTGTPDEADVVGGWDNDIFYGSDGADTISGGGGADQIYGGGGRDRISGDDGADRLEGDAGNDILYGGRDRDVLFGGAEADYLSGDDGDDALIGEAGSDTLLGGDGADSLRGGAGVDRYDGGEASDRVSFFEFGATQGAIVDLKTGVVANDGFGNRETILSVERLIGTPFADTMLGTDTANTFDGGADDTIRGFGGTDDFFISSVRSTTLDGGTGVNSLTLTGTVQTPNLDDLPTTVYADQNMVVDLSKRQVINDGFGFAATVAGFRNATTAGGDDTLTGSAAANGLHGGDGVDVLFGGAGNDVLAGNNGADTVTGGSGHDIFAFGLDSEYMTGDVGQGEYGDIITDFTQGQDRLDIQPGLKPLPFFGTEREDLNRAGISYEISGGDTYVHVRDSLFFRGMFLMTIKLDGVHELTAADFVAVRAAAGPFDFAPLHPLAHGDLASLALA